MGKGNRNRIDRYEDVYSMSGSGAAAKAPRAGAKKDRTTAILIAVIAILLLSALAIYIFSDLGIVERNTIYVSSDNFEVTGTMLPYYENLAYSATFEQYYNLYYNYVYSGDATQAYSAVAQMMSQYTLNDFFDSALASAQEMVALAEEATQKGVKLDEEDMDEIEESLKGASTASFGSGVKKRDLRAALELHTLAVKYAEILDEDIRGEVTEDDILAFVNENKADYYQTDALKYQLVLKATDYFNNELGYAIAERLIDTYADKLLAAKTEDEFKMLLVEYLVEKDFDALVEANKGELETPDEELVASVKAALTENIFKAVVKGEGFVSTVTDNATYAEVFEAVATKLWSNCTSGLGNLTVTESYTAAADDEILAWMSNDETKAGDTKMSEVKTDEEYSKTVYMITNPLHLDENETKDVAHILIAANEKTATAEEKAAAKEKAEKVLAEYKAGEQTLEAFEKLAETYTEDSGCVYEGVTKGQMVEAFENWTFDAARKAGDTDIVLTEYGYHIMYFIGDGEKVYYNKALGEYADEKYTERLDALKEAHIVLNQKAIDKKTQVTDTEAPETTKAPETTAAA